MISGDISGGIKVHSRSMLLAAATFIILLTSTFIAAADSDIVNFRLSDGGGKTRLVFDLSGPVNYSLFSLNDPERVVIDVKDVNLQAKLPKSAAKTRLLRSIRNAPRNNGDLRIVLDLKSRAQPKSFLLRPSHNAGYRLVIDLFEHQSNKPSKVAKAPPKKLRDVLIAVDAGHGGKDPGALGYKGTREKDVVLAIARKLARQIDRETGMRAMLTRDGDYYMGLRERIEKARKNKADLFISIHADAFKNRHARGSSVYALSLRGASSEAAQWLANRENAAELIGGVSLDDKDDLVASVLLDLSQTATIQSSLNVGSAILAELGQHNKLHKSYVQQAGFMVLKSPDIPSVLIETAFISNLEEERKLGDRNHQSKIAGAILRGIRRYFQRMAPPGTLLAFKHRKLEGSPESRS